MTRRNAVTVITAGVVMVAAVTAGFRVTAAPAAQQSGVVSGGSLAAHAADRSPLRTTAAGFSARGMLQVVAEGLAEMVRREYPGSSFVYEPGGPAGGIVRLARGERPFAIQTGTDLQLALAGSAPFRRAYGPHELLPVARIAQGFVVHVYARQAFLDQHGISDLAEVAARKLPLRVSTNPRGNSVGQAMARIILGYYGMSYESIEASGGEIIYLPTRASNDLMRNRRLDVVITAGFAPSSAIAELAVNTPIRMLPLEPGLVSRMVKELGMEPAVMPAGTYRFLQQDLVVAEAYHLITAGPHTPERDVYKVLSALRRQFDYYRGLHPSFANLDESMLGRTGPFARHPVAEQFFQQQGLLDSSMD